MLLKQLLLSTTFMVASNAFMVPAFLGGITRPSSSYSAARPLQMALIDRDSVRKSSDAQTLSDGTIPTEMGVSLVQTLDLPKEITDPTQTMFFKFEKGSKVHKHSHPAAGSYFVTGGSLEVTTNTESKTYEKGDFVIVPKDEEYELGGDAEVFYIYWEAEAPK